MGEFLDKNGLTYLWGKIKAIFPEGGSAYVPTLNAAPTSSTTTYTKDGQTVDFEIGQFCRVAKTGGGYDFYQLYDLQTVNNVATASWEKVVEIDDISDKENRTQIEAPVNTTDATQPITALSCEVGVYYRLDVAVETLAVTLPEMSDGSTLRGCVIYMTIGTTPNVTFAGTAHSGTTPAVYCQDGFSLESGNTYEVNCIYNGSQWVVAAVQIDATDVTPNNGGE